MSTIVIRENTSVLDYYDFQRLLGRGAYSGVVLGVNKETKKEYAIKVIARKSLAFKESVRMTREIDINFRISHQNIVKVYEVYKSEEDISLVLELMEGGDLFDYIAEKGPLSEENAKRYMKGVLEAVQYLHCLGIAHRDLKPENLVFSSKQPDSLLKLIDFGFAKMVHGHHVLETPIGTTCYAAPDISKQESYTPAVDMWSIGCILYFMLFSKPPFYSNDETEISNLVSKARYVIPDNPPVSSDVKELLGHLLQKRPELRYTATEALNHKWFKGSQNNQSSPKNSDRSCLTLSDENKSKLRETMNKIVDVQREEDEEQTSTPQSSPSPIQLEPVTNSTLLQRRRQQERKPQEDEKNQ